jgi:outer membrane protein TolC
MTKLFILIPVFFAFSINAQTELSLANAIEKALANNYQIKLIKANYEISQTQNSWGMAGFIPTFSLNVNNNNNLSDNTNNPASFFPGVVLSDNLNASLDMSWTVFSGFGIRINKERFDQLEEQTKGNAIVVIETTIYDIIVAYYTAVTQERKLDILKEMLQFSKSKLDYWQLKADIGIEPSIDLLQYKTQVLTDSSNYLLQQLSFKNAKRNLNLEMGEPFENEYALTDKIEFDVPAATWGELYDYMIANNQNIKNQYINVELQRLNTEAKQSAYYPVVTLNLGATPSVGRIELFGDNAFTTSTNSVNYYGNVALRYTLFNGYTRDRNVEIAKIQEEISVMQADELVLNLSHNLRAIFELYQTQSKVEDMSLERVKYGKMLWEMGVENYNMGTLNVFALNDIKLAYEQAVMNYYDRLFELVKTHFDLMRLTGTITQQFHIPEKLTPQE